MACGEHLRKRTESGLCGWCPGRNCSRACGPTDCLCKPCDRQPCCMKRARSARSTPPPSFSRTFQPSLFNQPNRKDPLRVPTR